MNGSGNSDGEWISKIDMQKVSKRLLVEIIEARYHEIFLLVKEELAKIRRHYNYGDDVSDPLMLDSLTDGKATTFPHEESGRFKGQRMFQVVTLFYAHQVREIIEKAGIEFDE